MGEKGDGGREGERERGKEREGKDIVTLMYITVNLLNCTSVTISTTT